MITVAETFQTLGQRRPAKGVLAEDAAQELIRKGLPPLVIDRLADAFGASRDEILKLIGFSRATGYRQKSQRAAALRPVYSDRAFRLARVFTLARSVFDDDQNAREWFRECNRALHGDRPIDLLDTETGTERVVRLLNQIERGVYT